MIGPLGRQSPKCVSMLPTSPAHWRGFCLAAARRNADTETNAPARRLSGGLADLARRGLATTTSTFSGVLIGKPTIPLRRDSERGSTFVILGLVG
jgi:hypothetical protein